MRSSVRALIVCEQDNDTYSEITFLNIILIKFQFTTMLTIHNGLHELFLKTKLCMKKKMGDIIFTYNVVRNIVFHNR